ncbi:MAG: electron transfer flavoprotein subunit beta/FixA family protein [Peptococcaceae bacterium]|nr:electron transfer flavoprotein subunit beta/FixA family protein [Peptococcaceae bacterium]
MNIVVLVKQVFDTEAKIVLSGNTQINADGVTQIMNPYDENAVEEALLLKERLGGEIIVVSMGTQKTVEPTLRTALAMGADRAVLVDDPALEGADQYTAAQALAKAISTQNYDLILSGKVAIDDQSSQVPARVAEILGIPHVNVATKIDVQGDKAIVTREIDGGIEIIETPLPAVITAQKSLNDPRYPSVPGIMKAKKKELKALSLADLSLSAEDVAAKMTVLEYSLPPGRQAGRLIPGDPAQAAAELASLLHSEAKII